MNKQQIIEKALKTLGDTSGDYNPDVFPYSLFDDLLAEAIDYISSAQAWKWSRADTPIECPIGSNVINLELYNIDYNRIENIYYIEGTLTYYLKRINKDKFKPLYSTPKVARPHLFAVMNNKVYLDKIPDKDYGLYICHYKHVDNLFNITDTPEVIPEKHHKIFSDYLSLIAFLLNKENASSLYEEFQRNLGQLKKENNLILSQPLYKTRTLSWV